MRIFFQKRKLLKVTLIAVDFVSTWQSRKREGGRGRNVVSDAIEESKRGDGTAWVASSRLAHGGRTTTLDWGAEALAIISILIGKLPLI